MWGTVMYSKEKQVAKKRIKPTQKQKGDISTKVRKEVKNRSEGICERCMCKYAVHMAHITSRKHIEHRTTADDLIHLCVECHNWLDQTPEGIDWKRRIKYEGNLLDNDEFL